MPWGRGTLLAGLVASVLILASCAGHGSVATTTSTATPRLAVTVDNAATPSGWVPFAYQDAEVSVPASWLVTQCGGSYPQPSVIVLGGTDCSISQGGGCAGPPCLSTAGPDNWIEFSSLPNPPASYRGHSSLVVNGFGVYKSSPCDYQCLSVYDVPSLGTEIAGAGPMFPKVLHTLSSSPRAVALEPGPASAIPSSWRRVSFGGLSISVPSSWSVGHQSFYDGCSVEIPVIAVPLSNNVVLNAGASGVNSQSERCESHLGRVITRSCGSAIA
jgi:hypothetical protein